MNSTPSADSKTPVVVFSQLGNDLALDENILGQTGDLDAASCRIWFGEILRIYAVYETEIVHILDEYGGFYDLRHVAAGALSSSERFLNT